MKKALLIFCMLLLVTTIVRSQAVVFTEDFEPPTNADNVISAGNPGFAINTRLFYTGTQCDTSFVAVGGTATLTTVQFSTAGYTNVLLKFAHICKVDIFDTAKVEISVNNGPWIKLTTQYINPGGSNYATQGYRFCAATYTDNIWQAAAPTAKPQQSWWRYEIFDISALAANSSNVKIRFVLKDGAGDGSQGNHGWYLDDITVVAGNSELFPPKITLKPPVWEDTVFTTGPFDVFAWIKDASGISVANLIYKLNNGSDIVIPMTWISDSTYKATIPSYTYNNRIDYRIYAEDNSAAHNSAYSTNKWFYTKKPGTFVVVGTGTATTNILPVNGLYNYSWGAQLYLASELNFSGQIDSIAFYVGNTPSNYQFINQRIFIGHTNANTYGTTIPDTSNMTIVYDGSYTFNGGGWARIKLQNPFYYNGTQNLLIYWANRDGTWLTGYPTFRYTSTSPNYRAAYKASDTYSSVFPSGTGTQTYNRPNLRIRYITTSYTEDAGVKQILSPTGSVSAGVNLPINLTIKNYGTDTLENVTIAWSLDGVLQTPSYAWTGELFEDVVSEVINVGSINVTPGPHVLKAWTEFPNGVADPNSSNDTITVSFYACAFLLSGEYTVGQPGDDFPTFTDLMTVLNQCGVDGPTVFKISSGTYNEQLVFGPINGASSVNTITFRPAEGANVVITSNSTTSTIRFNGADYIIFDGSNNGTNTRDMSIINTSTASNTAAVWLSSQGTGQGCVGITIKNCNIKAGANTSGIYGIILGGTTIGSAGADNDNCTIQNNSISKAYLGVWAQGTSTGANDNLLITGNSIGSNTTADYLGHDGILLTYANGALVEKNTIFNIITTNATPVGITFSTGVVSSSIIKNNINRIRYTGTSGYGSRGIYVNTNNSSSNLLIANNFISQIGGDGYSSFSASSPVGIYIDGTVGGLNIYYNSVYMSGNLGYNTATRTTAILFNTTTITNVDLRNNIFKNDMHNPVNGGAKNYAIYSTAPASSFVNINYNDYFVSGTQGVLGYLGSDRTTLSAWQAATGQDANSINVEPDFFSNTDLHTFSASINGMATPIANITDDIDGEPRNTTTPDIGADEFDAVDYNIALVSFVQPVSSCGLTANENVVVRLKNLGYQPINTVQITYVVNNGVPVTETMNQTINSGQIYDYTFTQQVDLSAVGNYTFKAYVNVAGDTMNENDTIYNYTVSSGFNFNYGAYTMGFEPSDDVTGWTKLDVNNDGSTWTFPYMSTTYARTGSYCARYNYNFNNNANDWLFSRCFKLNAGIPYKIEFWYRVYSASYAENLMLKVGTNNTPAAMTTTLVDLPSITNTTYQKATAIFTPTTTGVYYFGWYAYSLANKWDIYIDDINISMIPEQEAALISIVSPSNGCGLSNAEPVTIKIKNNGTAAINGNLTASYRFNNGSIVNEAVTTPIAVGDTLTFTFSQTVDASVTGVNQTFPIKAWISLAGDPFQYNDTLNKTINSLYVPDPPITINDTIAYGTSATLQAISSDMVFWYNVPTGGTPIATGNVFVTPNLYTQTVYWAEAATSGGIDSLHTVWAGGNGCSNGNMFDLYPFNNDLEIKGFIIRPNTTGNIPVSVYYKSGTYVGSETNPSAWTLVGTYNINAVSQAKTYLDVNDFTIPAQQTTGIYLNFNASYTNLTNTTTYTNADLRLTAGAGFCSAFSSPINLRAFNGTVIYSGVGCKSERVPDTAFIDFYANEASIVSIPSPVEKCTEGIENITIKIRNNGTDTINGNLNAGYYLNGTHVTELVPNTIYPGDTLTYTFSTPLIAGLSPANQDSVFNLKVYVSLPGDIYPANDTLTKTFTLKYTPPAPIVTNIYVPYGTSGTFNVISSDSLYWFNTPTGGTEIGQGSTFTTPVLYETTVYYVEARAGAPNVKITEVCQYRDGTGATNPYPSWITGADLIEITNLGTASINLQNYTMNIYGTGARTYTIPNVTLNPGQVMVLCAGTGTDNPANLYFNMGGTNDAILSSSLTGYALKDPNGGVVDAFAANGYIFTPASGVTANDWSGNLTGMSGFAGAIRVVSDNNTANDWIISSTSVLQTIGTLNPTMQVQGGSLGCASARVPDTAFVTGVPACDVSVQSIITPVTGIELSANEAVKIKVKNFGTNPAVNIPVHYKVNGGTPVNEIIPGPIASGQTIVYTFTQTADLSAFGTYLITAYTDLNCDATLINDTVHKTVTNNPLVYCASYATSPNAWEDIGNVTFSNLNNGIANPITNNPTAVNGYSDFTTTLPPVLLNVGVTYPISVTVISATSFYNTYVKVYIDYNRDGVFDPINEMVFGGQTTASPLQPTVTGFVTVPANAVTGQITRMRVVAQETSNASSVQPCGTYTWGETEDYAVLILPQIANDAGASVIIEPLTQYNEGESVPVKVLIKNYGYDPITNASNMVVAYSHNGGAPQSIIWNGGNIPPLATDTAFLPNIIVAPNANNICAWTQLAGDVNYFNDTVCKTFQGTPLYDAGITAFLQPGTQLMQGQSANVQVTVKNFGADTLTAFDLVYKVNGVVQATQAWTGMLLPNNTINITFNQPFTVPMANFTVCAYTSLSADANHANDTLCMNSYGTFISNLPYYDNFDGPVVNWTQQSNPTTTIWELGTPAFGATNSAHSAPNAWDINLNTGYQSSANSMLYTQYFNFSNAEIIKMKFWINYNVENNYDGTRIDYTIDNGTTWNVLGTMNDPLGVNWYNDDVIVSSNKPGWTNTSNGWVECEYDLSQFSNVPAIRFRFVFTSDGSVNKDGVSIDDFSITVLSAKDAGVVNILSPVLQAPAGSSRTVKVRIKNFGLDTLYSIPVSYRVGLTGTPTTATWTGILPPEDTISYTFTLPLIVPPGTFYLYAYTGLPQDGDNMNDTTKVKFTGVQTFNVPYSDNFEGTVNWFSSGTVGLWEYGVPTAQTINSAHSPVNVWATRLNGYYVNNATEFLYSPLFMFNGIDSAYLEFWHWYQTETSYDGCRVEYSINGGAWTILGTQGSPNSVNWYNTSINGVPCWSGNSGGWVFSKFKLANVPAIVNSIYPVQFRFRFFSNAANSNFDGWAIDDFALTAPPIPKDAGVIAILQPNGPTQTGSQVTVKVKIKNFGLDTLQSVPVRFRITGGAIVSGTWTGVLNPGNTADFTFPTTFTSPGSTYTLCAWTRKQGDIYTYNDTTCATFTTTPASNDVGISRIVSPGTTTIYGQADSVKVYIKNYGTATITSVPVVFSRNFVQVGAGIWTGTLAPGDSVLYTFSTVNVSPLGNYNLCAKTMLSGDANPANDEKCIYVEGIVGIENYDYSSLELLQNVPNPSNDNTLIVFYVPQSDKVLFEVTDVLGNTIIREDKTAVRGKNKVELNVANIPAGIYFYSVEYKGQKLTKRMIVTK